jgi:hypothetical protein
MIRVLFGAEHNFIILFLTSRPLCVKPLSKIIRISFQFDQALLNCILQIFVVF